MVEYLNIYFLDKLPNFSGNMGQEVLIIMYLHIKYEAYHFIINQNEISGVVKTY